MKWSYSAHTTMRRCQRALAIGHVMASARTHDRDRHEAYILKQLQHLPAWRGSLVHAVLAADFPPAIGRGRPFPAAALTEAARDLARRQLAFSRAKRYRDPQQTKAAAGDAYCALIDHEHGGDLSPDALAALDVTLARCFDHLAQQGAFLDLLYAGAGHATEQRLSFPLDGATVTATLDLVFVAPGGRRVVVDWKVGGSEASDYRRQLLVYALAVTRSPRWGPVPPDAVDLYEVNLLENAITAHAVDATDLEEAEDFVYRSVTEMRMLLDDGVYDALDLDALEVAARPTTCAYCTLRPLCVDLLERGGRADEVELIQGRLF